MKPIQCLPLLAIVFLLFSCKDYTAKSSEEMIMNSAVVTQSKLLTHTVADGQRLTKEALMSYLPISIGDMKKSDEIQFDRSADKHTEGIYHSVSQDYSNGNESLSIQVRDYADDPNRINKIKEGRIKEGASEETGFSQRTYKNEKGWYIDEMEKYRGVGNEKTIIESDISITTPRFYVALQAFPKMGESAPGASSLITLIDKSQLPKLFKLSVPQGEGDIENPGDDDAYTTISKDPYLSMAIKIIS